MTGHQGPKPTARNTPAPPAATRNPLKDLQIRLGHSNIGTTALYLRSIEIQSCEIPDEIAFLYGDDVKDPPDPSAA